MTITLRDLLNDGKVHVLDGAMGTMLYAKGFFLNVCYDELNLKQPKLVQEVHEAYVRAGAEILETNTFGANPVKLGSYGLADDTEKINQAAAELARRAAAGRDRKSTRLNSSHVSISYAVFCLKKKKKKNKKHR